MKLNARKDTHSDTKIPEILYEDSHILVCLKPHGVAVQSRQLGTPDMVGILKNHIHQCATDKGEPYLAVIHRLDQPVKGILVFAKTPFAARELNKQLTQQKFGKYYRALVSGQPPQSEDTLEDYMLKDARTNQSHVCSGNTNGAKLARLHYTVVSEQPRYFSPQVRGQYLNASFSGIDDSDIEDPDIEDSVLTELDIRLETGRHHQIRVQLAHMGCPIIGDTKYNPHCEAAHTWQNICLCAYRLDFAHPKTHKPLHFHLL